MYGITFKAGIATRMRPKNRIFAPNNFDNDKNMQQNSLTETLFIGVVWWKRIS